MTTAKRFELQSQKTDFPVATEIIFHQAAPPVGWTITADNDKLLRVTTSVGADGGTNSITSAVLTTGNESTHTHAGSSTHSSHTHTITLDTGANTTPSGEFVSSTAQTTSDGPTPTLTHDSTGPGVAHNHAMDPDFAYTDTIIAAKD